MDNMRGLEVCGNLAGPPQEIKNQLFLEVF